MKKIDLYDVFIFIGMIILGTGIWLISPPIALIILGVIFICLGLFGARREGAK